MIEILRFIAGFCFWLFVAVVMLGLSAIGFWVLAIFFRAVGKK